MNDLHERLRAAVDERKRIATAAAARLTTWGNGAYATPTRILADCKRDLSVLDRHNPDSWPFEGHCFWCSEETFGESILVAYPCPEIQELAEEYGVEVAL